MSVRLTNLLYKKSQLSYPSHQLKLGTTLLKNEVLRNPRFGRRPDVCSLRCSTESSRSSASGWRIQPGKGCGWRRPWLWSVCRCCSKCSIRISCLQCIYVDILWNSLCVLLSSMIIGYYLYCWESAFVWNKVKYCIIKSLVLSVKPIAFLHVSKRVSYPNFLKERFTFAVKVCSMIKCLLEVNVFSSWFLHWLINSIDMRRWSLFGHKSQLKNMKKITFDGTGNAGIDSQSSPHFSARIKVGWRSALLLRLIILLHVYHSQDYLYHSFASSLM